MKHNSPAHRRGAALIAALVCLSIIVGLLGHMLVGALRMQRQLHRERELRQCQLLLEAGLQRGAAQLTKDRAYRGETWEVALADRQSPDAGRVIIEVVEATNDQPAVIRAQAEYPLVGANSIRRTQTITTQLLSQHQE